MPQTLYTAEDLFRLPDDPPYELDRGVLVPMTKTSTVQALVCSRLVRRIGNFVEEHGLGETLCNDPGFVLERRPDTVRAPDVAFVRADRLSAAPDWYYEQTFYEGAPDLAVEVIWSRSTRGEVRQKLPRLFANGCPLAWVFDIQRGRAEVHRPGQEPRIVGMDGVIDGEDVLPGFRLPVADILRGFGPRKHPAKER